jgi:hypothetical protein
MGRQSLRANFLSKSETPKMLHGASLRGIGLWVEGGAGFGVDQKALDVSAS